MSGVYPKRLYGKGKDNTMGKKNTTANRVQAAMNFIGGDNNLDLLMAGEARVEIETEFVATAKFRLSSKEVCFEEFGNSFIERFLGVDGTVEKFSCNPSLEYIYYQNSSSTSQSVIDESLDGLELFLGEDVADATLYELYELLKKQPNGETEGDLVVGEGANFFRIQDNSKRLSRIVCVHWGIRGWVVCADCIEKFQIDDIMHGDRLFYRPVAT